MNISKLNISSLFDFSKYDRLKNQVERSTDIGVYKKARCLSLIRTYYCERLEPPTLKTLKQMSRVQIARLIKMAKSHKTRK